jgi:hypothetical protein
MDRLGFAQKLIHRFKALRRLPGKARKRRNIKHIPSFRNAARQDASALKM